jgi:hypothetical protein
LIFGVMSGTPKREQRKERERERERERGRVKEVK